MCISWLNQSSVLVVILEMYCYSRKTTVNPEDSYAQRRGKVRLLDESVKNTPEKLNENRTITNCIKWVHRGVILRFFKNIVFSKLLSLDV